ncbi:SDR family oxidoreductase [Salinisphaera sp.]|uniref:SDR family oxidoreductase n=1 Tax=Salinisphaera sp. TaxID=1914330 RepID=UPI002D78D0F2|nr:SDR family oxidoreductase [Salinisphaera sp.]HET7313593.1 SDR family oxidoreductase [Salinisphaera sp.]
MSDNNIRSRRIAITGAGSGLGRALALRHARAGWRVAVTDIQAGRARGVAEEVNDAGGQAMAQTLDTRRESDFEQLMARLNAEWRGVDVFVNNAGVASSGSVADTPQADWDWIVDINLMGVVRGCRAALPALRASRGHIVNTASFAAIANAPGMVSYNVAKAAVLSLSETLRAEEHAHGVGVTVACPAFFATNLMESFRSTAPGREALVEKLMARSGVTAENVAEQIFDAVAARRFLVLTHRDTRWQYRLKRLQPELFFRAVEKTARSMFKPRKGKPA